MCCVARGAMASGTGPPGSAPAHKRSGLLGFFASYYFAWLSKDMKQACLGILPSYLVPW